MFMYLFHTCMHIYIYIYIHIFTLYIKCNSDTNNTQRNIGNIFTKLLKIILYIFSLKKNSTQNIFLSSICVGSSFLSTGTPLPSDSANLFLLVAPRSLASWRTQLFKHQTELASIHTLNGSCVPDMPLCGFFTVSTPHSSSSSCSTVSATEEVLL